MSTLLLSSCWILSFDKDFYERVTGIKFPDKYKVLQTFDNGEYLTGAAFQLDSSTFHNFIANNHFDILKNKRHFTMLSIGLFDKSFQPDTSGNNTFFVIQDSRDKNDWTYLADPMTYRLWTEISYPDWGGQ